MQHYLPDCRYGRDSARRAGMPLRTRCSTASWTAGKHTIQYCSQDCSCGRDAALPAGLRVCTLLYAASIWSVILISNFGIRRATNSIVESYFRYLKHSVLKKTSIPLPEIIRMTMKYGTNRCNASFPIETINFGVRGIKEKKTKNIELKQETWKGAQSSKHYQSGKKILTPRTQAQTKGEFPMEPCEINI